MLQNVSLALYLLFGITTLVTLFGLIKTIRKAGYQNWGIPIFLIGWLILQAVLSFQGFYSSQPLATPPRLPVLILVPVLVMVVLFSTSKGRSFIDSLPLENLTGLHSVRVMVEMVLYGLFLKKAVPELMTFEGRNFDIIAGFTAPLIVRFGFQKKIISRPLILAWNFICLGLLFNIVVNAILAAPSIIQQQAFDQPNIAVLYFPFSWLPSFVVPVVLFSHLVAIRQLLKKSAENISTP